MGIVSKEIEVIASFLKKDYPRPLRFRIQDKGENKVINIDKIISIDKIKIAGGNVYLYRCQGIINNFERVFELKYDLDKCRWLLFKI